MAPFAIEVEKDERDNPDSLCFEIELSPFY